MQKNILWYHPVVAVVVDGHAVTSISLGVYKTVVCAPIQPKRSHKLVMAPKVPLIPIYDKNRSEWFRSAKGPRAMTLLVHAGIQPNDTQGPDSTVAVLNNHKMMWTY